MHCRGLRSGFICSQLDERISDIESSCVDFDQLVESEHQATARTHACIRDLCEAFNLLASCEKLESDTSLDIPAETFSMIEDFVHEVSFWLILDMRRREK